MDTATYNAWLAQQHRADRDEAHENACDALHAIRALQATDTWHELPLSVRRLLCASHATLGAIADSIARD
jgi:hypothetical protein